MIRHIDLGPSPFARSRNLYNNLLAGSIKLGGNRKLHIYGRIDCSSGKRMKPENRVFFSTVAEAEKLGYRPCSSCMWAEYQRWKSGAESERQR